MDKIKNQLAGVAALLGVIAAIGGGFVKYGEIVTKLDALESASGGKDWSANSCTRRKSYSIRKCRHYTYSRHTTLTH